MGGVGDPLQRRVRTRDLPTKDFRVSAFSGMAEMLEVVRCMANSLAMKLDEKMGLPLGRELPIAMAAYLFGWLLLFEIHLGWRW